MKKRNHQHLILTTSVVTALVTGAGVENAKVNAENPRVSAASTSILSNTNAVGFSGEIVAPASGVLIRSADLAIRYGLAPNFDPSQILIDPGPSNGDASGIRATGGSAFTYSSGAMTNTVEAAIARSISSAVQASRYGDVIGIVNAYNPPEDQNIENASVAIALTNILSNTNVQNFAAEIVAPPDYFLGLFRLRTESEYQNATNYGSPDSSQVVIDRMVAAVPFSIQSITATSITNTVEGAIASAISSATGASRYGDVIGIVNVYKGPGTQNPRNARASVALTNILSNTNSQNVAGEIVMPDGYLITRIDARPNYTNASSYPNFGDPSQVVVRNVRIDTNANSVEPVEYIRPSVDSTIANAITTANDANRFGDVIGIVNAYKGPWDNQALNPSVSLAVTNILSNTNSQNFAAEMVAPRTDLFYSGILITNTNPISYIVPGSDNSQLAISSATVSGQTTDSTPFTNTSVEAVTANAIRNAETQGRIGDVIGITRAWQSGGRASLD